MHFVGAVAERHRSGRTRSSSSSTPAGTRRGGAVAPLATRRRPPRRDRRRRTARRRTPPSATLIDVEPLFATSRSRLHGSLAHRIAGDIIRGGLRAGLAAAARRKRQRIVRRLAQRLSRGDPHPCRQGHGVASAEGRHQGRAALGLAHPRSRHSRLAFRVRARRGLHSQPVRAAQDRRAERRRAGGDAPHRRRSSAGWPTRCRAWRAPIRAPAPGSTPSSPSTTSC